VVRKKIKLKRHITGYVFLLPWLVIFGLFVAYPFFYGFGISLFDSNYVKNVFVGFENYRQLFNDNSFLRSIMATLRLAVIILPGTTILSLLIANTIFSWGRRFQNLAKAVFYLPTVVSEVALVIVWKWMFNPTYGLSITITNALGLPSLDWLGDLKLAVPMIAVLVMGFTIAQPVILYSAAMNNISPVYYEVAELEGANRWKQFMKITLPLLKPTTAFVLITSTIASLQIIAVPYLLTAGGPQYGTTTVLLMIYRNAFEYGRYGYAAAMGVILFCIIAVFAVLQYRVTKTDVQY
jgi:multiple sugar transport system permease protein